MSLDKIQQLIGSLAKTIEGNEKLATPILAAKLTKCASTNPHDQTIGMVSRVIGDMVYHNNLFINKADFKALYQKLYSNGSKFGELFQEELGEAPPDPSVKLFQRDDTVKAGSYQVSDQILANALGSAFDNQLPLKMYSQPLANKALKSVGSALDAWNLRPTALTISTGSDKFIVIKADYDTPKGMTSFYVPVEVHNKDIVEASVFMGNTGPQELNHTNIKSYVTSSAGAKLKIDAASILGVLTKAASENRQVSDTELALTRLTTKRQGQSEFFQGSIVGQKMAVASVEDVKLPRLEETDTFEKKFNTAQGLASMQFGNEKISVAKTHIARELNSFGYNNPQVVVTGHDASTILFGVSLDTGKAAFTVPVKVANGKLTKPTLLLCNGSVSAFDRSSVGQIVAERHIDTKVAAAASTMSALKPSAVIDDLRQAVAEGNHAKAEDALNVLANSGDVKAYATAFQIYKDGLAGHKQAETKCSKMIKSAISEHPICSHTGLPVNKVYQDKSGYCRPLFRKGMDETYEGASFINSKIFG